MKKIIVLETFRGFREAEVRYVLWFTVPVDRRISNPLLVSAYKETTAPELAALRDGSVYEELHSLKVPIGQSPAQVRGLLEARYEARLAEISALPNVDQFYGLSWNGTVWR